MGIFGHIWMLLLPMCRGVPFVSADHDSYSRYTWSHCLNYARHFIMLGTGEEEEEEEEEEEGK